MSKTVTIEQVLAWGPCYDYHEERLAELFAGRDTLTAREIVALDIPHDDALWALCHSEFLSDEQMHLLACDFAERVVHLCGDDPRPRAAIEAKRAWVRGEISDEELAAARAAAGDAAWDAARDAAWDAAWAAAGAAAGAAARDAARAAAGDAAGAAARDAARDAAWDAARDAAREWQLERTLEVIEATE